MKKTLHFTFLRTLTVLVFGLFFNVAWGQTEYVWNCSSATTPTSGTNSNITTGTWIQGNNNGSTTLITTGSPSAGYAGSSGTSNFGLAARTGAINTGTNGSAFVEISFTPAPGYSLSISSVSFGSRSTGTGAALASIRTSLDNYGSTVASNALSTGGNWQLISPSMPTAISGGQSVAITLRIYGSNGSGNPSAGTANWRLDDIKIIVAANQITTWNGAAWSNGIPTSSSDVIIAGDYSTAAASPQGPFTAKSLTVNSGVFTLASATSITVENAIVNSAGSNNFIVENNANLIQTNAVANTGSIKVKRNSNLLYRFDYTLWSSPVIGQNLKAFSSATLSNRFYTYNTATGANGDYEAVFPAQTEGTYSFEAGKGYLIRTPDSHAAYVEGNPGTAINAEFAGVPYNQSVNVALSNANTGFNLVGNPYPSAISISQLFSSNTDAIDGTIWFWRKRNGAVGSGYATSTGVGVTSAQPEAAALNPNGVIGAGQGFFVKVKSGATQNTLNFSNALRSTTGGSFFRNSNTNNVEKHRIWLNLSNGTDVIGQTLLGYMDGATSGIDYGIEGKYFNDSPVAFTSYIQNQEFAIQGRSLPFTSDDVVPMSFKTDVAGNYAITIDHVDGLFAASQDVFLKDNFTGQIHNLKTSGYSFATETGVFNNRFEIVYRSLLSVDVPTISSNNIVVYKQSGSLVINSGNYIMDKVELYDISGRLVYSKNNVDAATAVISNLAISNQVLIVKITTAENGTANKKIVY